MLAENGDPPVLLSHAVQTGLSSQDCLLHLEEVDKYCHVGQDCLLTSCHCLGLCCMCAYRPASSTTLEGKPQGMLILSTVARALLPFEGIVVLHGSSEFVICWQRPSQSPIALQCRKCTVDSV